LAALATLEAARDACLKEVAALPLAASNPSRRRRRAELDERLGAIDAALAHFGQSGAVFLPAEDESWAL